MKPKTIIGLISGTSLDGIDAALVYISWSGNRPQITVEAAETFPFNNKTLPERLREFTENPSPSVDNFDQVVADEFTSAAKSIIRKADLVASRIDCIASHGQTVWYFPKDDMRAANLKILGNGDSIAKATGIRTAYDFRTADLKAGGCAAPLAPLLHYYLFNGGTAVLNIGGIANITTLPRGGKLGDVFAFDTGPGNSVIDEAVRHFSGGSETGDIDGKWSVRGKFSSHVVKKLLEHPYFSKPIPKATDRTMFGKRFFNELVTLGKKENLSQYDVVATAVRLTAESIALSYKRFIKSACQLTDLVVVGGGRLNPTLMHDLASSMPELNVFPSEQLDINGDFIEAELMALLGFFTLNGFPGNLPKVTGANYPVVLGTIVDP